MNKYNYVFSIGEACSCAESLNKNNLRRYSGPFDWLWGASFYNRITFIMNDFENFTTKEYLKPVNDPTSSDQIYINTLTDIRFNHDFPRGVEFDNAYLEFEKKYKRRINRFLNILRSSKKVLLVYVQCPNIINTRYQNNEIANIKKACELLNTKYPNADILYINHNENLNDGQVIINKISNNLFYAECFNYYKNNIQKNNNANYENISKVLSYFSISNKYWNKFMRTMKNIGFIFYKNKPKYLRILIFRFNRK